MKVSVKIDRKEKDWMGQKTRRKDECQCRDRKRKTGWEKR